MPHANGIVSITATTHQHLCEKRDELASRLDNDKRELYGLAGEEKDPTGNHPLKAAQEEISRLEGQVEELDYMLSNARIVADDNGSCTTVSVGKRVVLHLCRRNCSEEEGERLEVIVDGFCGFCGEGEKIITPESPVGAAIIGAEAGEERQFVSPRGELVQIVIISVSSR